MAEHDQPSSTNPSEIEALISRLKQSNLSESDSQMAERLFRLLLTLIHLVERKNASISRLKRLLFGPGADERTVAVAPSGASGHDAPSAADGSSEPNALSKLQIAERAPRRGHGRRGAADYTGARRVACALPQLSAGERCPSRPCGGHLYDTKAPAVFIRLEGRPLISATQYEQQVLRCSTCQARFTAPLPAGVPPQKYDPTADVAIAPYKYGAAVPFYRQARLQAMCGVPVAESVQYERCALVAECVRPVYEELVRMAASAEVLHSDDTRVVILDLLKENQQIAAGERRGVQTSGIVARIGQRQIALYLSGRRHAGENIAELLGKRAPGLAPPIQMSDALSANWGGEFERIVAKCLAHARRQFVDIEPAFPKECGRVLEALGAVYGFDAQTRAMNDEQRLLFHQQHSGAVVEALRVWLDEQISERLVEPNSSLGRAFAYLLKHWEGLTKFLTAEGAPLDNNVCERALKSAVLQRKNALFYKTQRGASTGDCLMSVIQTCALNHTNVWEYLLALVSNERMVGRDPTQWLPWNYRAAASERRAQAA